MRDAYFAMIYEYSMENNLQNLRHSLAHLLAAAVLELWPDAKRAIGPAIDNGFYYDFDFGRRSSPSEGDKGGITENDLPRIEAKMREILPTWHGFEHREVSADEARTIFKDNPYKLELIDEFSKESKPLTVYSSGNYVDLCKGGHVENASEIKPDAFKITHTAGAYWRGNEKNKMLTRIYGLAFATREELEKYIAMQEEAKKRDHKILGPQLDLFTFSDLVGAGLPLWTPKGTTVRNLLDSYVWQLRKTYGYQQVDIPHITKKDLYVTSGHWAKFKDGLFRIKTREKHEYAMKPMNCPHHTQIYARKQWSYRELPQRYASTTKVYRDEQTGELSGIQRVLAITQDDAHVFCRMGNVKTELNHIWDIVHTFYETFGFKLRLRLSLHDPAQSKKYIGNKKVWQKAESILREVAQEHNTEFYEATGEAAFYGPKLDFMAHDAIGREHQVATIQLDMAQPERFDLTCINEKGERERIVMVHAAIMGSIERFMANLIEHYAGAFPTWLAPVQIAILPISEKHNEYAYTIGTMLEAHDIRCESFDKNDSIGKKIREAELQKIPYLLIVGDKEMDSQSVAVRARGIGDKGMIHIEEFTKTLLEEILHKK